MVNYKDTILAQKQIKWKRPPAKVIDDGRVDIIITIPLTEILDLQAKTSYFAGANEIFKFIIEKLLNHEEFDEDEIKNKLRDMGLEIAN